MASVDILNKEGKASGKVDLPEDIFGTHVNKNVLHQAVVMYRACARQGTVATKERAEVRGGGKKPYRQKGTGRARAGSSRSPLWKGGGTTFGPQPRDFSYSIPKKVRKAALRESLNAKFKDQKLQCLDELTDEFNKTKDFAQILKNIGIKGKVLAVLDGCNPSIERVSRNIRSFSLVRSIDVNAYHILSNKNLLVTKTALNKLLERATK